MQLGKKYSLLTFSIRETHHIVIWKLLVKKMIFLRENVGNLRLLNKMWTSENGFHSSLANATQQQMNTLNWAWFLHSEMMNEE